MSSPFVLPQGLSLALGGNSLVIRHAGDVVLEQGLGRKLSRVEAGGDLTLRFGPVHGALLAQGTLTTEGDVDADALRAAEVHIGAAEVKVRAIVALRRVVIGAANLDVDVVVAPEVVIDPAATGRIRVLDCLNDRPPLRVRGCLSLEEFEADFGGAAEFLARRGVIPVNPLPSSGSPDDDGVIALDEAESTQETQAVPRTATSFGVGRAAEGLRARGRLTSGGLRREVPPEPGAMRAEAPRPAAREEPLTAPRTEALPVAGRIDAPRAEPVREPVREPVKAEAGRTERAEGVRTDTGRTEPGREVPKAEPPSDPSSHPVAAANTPRAPARRDLNRQEARLRRTVTRVTDAYAAEAPEAVRRLGRLADAGSYDELAANLDALWTETLRAHIDRGTQPPRTVISSFHALYALIFT